MILERGIFTLDDLLAAPGDPQQGVVRGRRVIQQAGDCVSST
jgi:hypothetical protein